MTSRAEQIDTEIRETPLLERLEKCRRIVANITAERRTTKISIPPRSQDEDMYLCRTLEDAIEALTPKEKP